VLYMIRGDWHS